MKPIVWVVLFAVLILIYPFFGTTKTFAQYGGGVCTTYTSTEVPRAINNGTPATSNITVSGMSTLVWVNVRNLNISHNNDTDLDVYLRSPIGTLVMLFTDVGGTGNNFTNTNFYQLAGVSIIDGSAPFTGWYRPESSLNSFIGENGSGTWQLQLTDDNNNSINGTLNGWQLELCQSSTPTATPTNTPSPTPVVPTATPNPSARGTIVASPNPCQIPAASSVCASTIGWSTSGGVTAAEVWVEDSVGGAGEVGFGSGVVGNQAAPWIQAPPHSYTFRLYNTSGGGRQLLHSVVVTGNPSTNILPAGSHESVNNSACKTTGWTYDPDSGSTSIQVRIYRDSTPGTGTLIYSGATNVLRNDVNSTYGITGNHGFDVAFTPASGLFDGATHPLYVYGVDNENGLNQPLTGTPKDITCGTSTPTPTPTPANPSGQLTGTVLVEGTSGYTLGANIQVYDGSGNPVPGASATTDGSGNYTLTDTSESGPKTIVITGLSGNYAPTQVSLNNGSWTSSGLSGNAYNFDFTPPPSPYELDWWISNASGWTQINGGGDVRKKQITETVPGGSSGATGTPSTVFFSSDLPANFGSGTPGGLVVNSEFGYNSDPKTRSGFFSYTFFVNRARVINVPFESLPAGCSATACELTGLQSGKVYKYDGDLKITSYNHPSPNGHVLLLVNGKLTISSNISNVLPNLGNLLVIAAKDDVIIDRTVGGAPGSTTAHIQAILTSEKSVILDGTRCSDGVTPDLRLNFEGSIVTNSLKPFATNQPGIFRKNRSLCSGVAGDGGFPVMTLRPRYDFVPQLTDFYKVPSVRWKEVAP